MAIFVNKRPKSNSNDLSNINYYFRKKIDKYNRIEENILQTLKEKKRLIDRKRLHLKVIIGEGNFGYVYKALLSDSNDATIMQVAAKTVRSGKDYTNNVVYEHL